VEKFLMKNLRNLLAVLAVVMIASHTAFAGYGAPSGSVPEIAPAMGTGALALLSGAILVIRGRVKH
jgi:hypothetical protein